MLKHILKVKKTDVAFYSLLILAILTMAVSYLCGKKQIELVEAKSNIDMSALKPENPGCKITGPDGSPLDINNSGLIPKGTLINGECFGFKSK